MLVSQTKLNPIEPRPKPGLKERRRRVERRAPVENSVRDYPGRVFLRSETGQDESDVDRYA